MVVTRQFCEIRYGLRERGAVVIDKAPRKYRLQDYVNAEADVLFRSDEEVIQIWRSTTDYQRLTPHQKAARAELQRRGIRLEGASVPRDT